MKKKCRYLNTDFGEDNSICDLKVIIVNKDYCKNCDIYNKDMKGEENVRQK